MPGSWLGSRGSLGRCLSITHGNMVSVPWLPQNSPSMVTACGVSPHLATHTHMIKLTRSFSQQGTQQTCALAPREPGCVPLLGHSLPPMGYQVLEQTPR